MLPAERPESGREALRIFHIAAPAEVGGLERVVQGLAAGQRRMGHETHVIAVVGTDDTPAAFVEPLTRAGVPVHLVRVPARGYLSERRQVGELIARFLPDLVHTHGYRSDLLHLGTLRGLGVPAVTTLHGSSRMGGVSHLFEWLQERTLRRFDGVVAVSRMLFERLMELGVSTDRLHLIPNAWPGESGVPALERMQARETLQAGSAGFLYGWVGRLIRAKGCDVFLDALARLEPGGWCAVIVGDGPERPALERQAAALGLGDQVRFAGQVAEAERVMTAFDAFVLSSRTEGTPMVLFEAMAAGVPVAACAVGGVPDVLAGDAALLVPPLDADCLAGALRQIRDDGDGRTRRVNRARTRLHEEYSVAAWLELHDRAYRAAREGSRQRREHAQWAAPLARAGSSAR
jgi:glycosyltransferase involved in cell wall biosynthesis